MKKIIILFLILSFITFAQSRVSLTGNNTNQIFNTREVIVQYNTEKNVSVIQHNSIVSETAFMIDGQKTEQVFETRKVNMDYTIEDKQKQVFSESDLSQKKEIIQKKTDLPIQGKLKFEQQIRDLPDLIMFTGN